jgi:hypothetical protein
LHPAGLTEINHINFILKDTDRFPSLSFDQAIDRGSA